MLFKNIKKINSKQASWIALALIVFAILLFFISNSINTVSEKNQDVFAYTVKVRNTVKELDKIFEQSEMNVTVMVDAISNSYDTSKQKNEAYNLHFIEGINGLIKAVLSNSPNVDGSWFQLNADLPFSTHAYNWYEFKDNQFIDVKDQFAGTPSMDRKITPEADPYYFDAINNRKPTWSDIYTDADTKASMMTISAPIYKEGILIGVVGIDISVNNLQQSLKEMQSVLGDSELYLLDKKDNVILSQLLSNLNLVKNNYPFLELFNENNEGPIEYYDYLTKKTAIKLTLSNGYKIIISIDNKGLFSGTNQIINIIYILFILLTISTVLTFTNYFKGTNINPPTKIVDEETEVEENEKD